MPSRLNVFPDLLVLAASLGLQALVTRWIIEIPSWRSRPKLLLLVAGNLIAAAASVAGYLLSFHRTWRYLPALLATWLQAGGMLLSVVLACLAMGLLVRRSLPRFDSPRRRFLQTAGTALAVAPLAATAFGIIERNRFRLNQVKIYIPNLPRDLEGLRLVQITDIHLSPFLSPRQFAHAIDLANEAKPHVVLVTGDLITRTGDPLDACLRQLARLRSDAGALGCLGNHEIYTNTQDYVTEQGKRIGIQFLRNQAQSLRFGNASINFAGVDYQPFRMPYLAGADALVAPGQLNILLSHNPDVFPVAASQGYQLTLAGHTHGGQVNFEILHHNLNVAQAFTPFTRGLYQRGASSLFVSSGLGTIGVPVRMGAPPEVSLLQLCAS